MSMKDILIEYRQLRPYLKLLERRIKRKEDSLCELRMNTVSDSVKGGMGGTQIFKIEGLPCRDIEHLERSLSNDKKLYEQTYDRLFILEEETNKILSGIKDIQTRSMVELYFMEGMTYIRVAREMNEIYPNHPVYFTDESCRQRIHRFLKNEKPR